MVAGEKLSVAGHQTLLNASNKCLLWPLRHCGGNRVGSALYDEVLGLSGRYKLL